MNETHDESPASDSGTPHNPSVAFERSDVNPRGIAISAIGLAAGIAGSMALILSLFWHFHSDETREKNAELVLVEARRQPAEGEPGELLPPTPRLEGIAPVTPDRLVGRLPQASGQLQHDVGRIRPGAARRYNELQDRLLNETWEWTDKDHTAARVPMAEAKEMSLAKPGAVLKSRNQADRPAVDVPPSPPSRSNSGRSAEGGNR